MSKKNWVALGINHDAATRTAVVREIRRRSNRDSLESSWSISRASPLPKFRASSARPAGVTVAPPAVAP